MLPRRMVCSLALGFLFIFSFTVMNGGLTSAYAEEKAPIKVGLMYDATGPVSPLNIPIAAGGRDYVKVLNKKGGINGHPIESIEHEFGYKVPLAVEGFERYRKAGVLTYWANGTPVIYALTEKTTEAKIPATTPGFGRADAADGTRFPYIFPIAATYWSQAGGAIKFVTDQWAKEGKKEKPKIAYLYFDNPAGREPLVILEKLQKKVGFELKTWAVPSPGIEQSAQVLDIVTRYKADWVVVHIFGKGTSVSIKELKRTGFPMNRVIGFVWASSETDMEAAGWDVAEGYHTIQFAGVGQHFPVVQDIIKLLYKDESIPVPENLTKYSVCYNRGILWMAVGLEAARIALEKYGTPLTGEKVKNGFEQIKGFTLGGLVPPLVVTPEDHEGGGFVQIYQVKAGKLVAETEWFQGFREVVVEAIKEAGQAPKK